MKVMVYINWCENIIYTEKQFEKEVIDTAEEKFDDSDIFDEWLSRNFDPSEVFSFTEPEKEAQRARYKTYCIDEARCQLSEEYEEIELEI